MLAVSKIRRHVTLGASTQLGCCMGCALCFLQCSGEATTKASLVRLLKPEGLGCHVLNVCVCVLPAGDL